MKTVLQELKEKLQEKVNNPMSIQIECDIFQRVVDVIDEVYFEKEKEQIEKAYYQGWVTRERFHDLSPEITYPVGLDYEEKQEYAFNLWFGQFKKK